MKEEIKFMEIKLDAELANKYAMAEIKLTINANGENEIIIDKEYMVDHEGNIYVPINKKKIKKIKSLLDDMDYAELTLNFDYEDESRFKCISYSTLTEIINNNAVIYL